MVINLRKSQPVVIEKLSLPSSPFQLYSRIASEQYSFILDSPESGFSNSNLAHYSFLGCDPFLTIKSYQENIHLFQNGKLSYEKGNPLDILGEFLKRYRLNISNIPSPLAGGAVGYIGYETRHFIENVPEKNVDDLLMPHLYFAFYDCILVYDHIENRAYIISNGLPEEYEEKRIKRAGERIKEFKFKLETGNDSPSSTGVSPVPSSTGVSPVPSSTGVSPVPSSTGVSPVPSSTGVSPVPSSTGVSPVPSSTGVSPVHLGQRPVPPPRIKSNFTRDKYLKAVKKVKDYIVAGDIFQANLSQRFETMLPVSPFMLYSRLRQVNPSPFSAYLNYPEGIIACSSPERFLKVSGNRVETRPIKGTRPRGRTPAEDRVMSQSLLGSSKDRAENVMIVDLERNDLGRVCQYGSIKVDELTSLETFPTVFHLTSTISGKLQADKGIIDLLKATFPGGSITGAPKVRAMEIIDEMEPNQRGPYTGSLGYISFNGDADLNIIIRTFILKGNKAYFNVGGGIVHDSQPELEYQETLDKARGLLRALNLEGIRNYGINNR